MSGYSPSKYVAGFDKTQRYSDVELRCFAVKLKLLRNKAEDFLEYLLQVHSFDSYLVKETEIYITLLKNTQTTVSKQL